MVILSIIRGVLMAWFMSYIYILVCFQHLVLYYLYVFWSASGNDVLQGSGSHVFRIKLHIMADKWWCIQIYNTLKLPSHFCCVVCACRAWWTGLFCDYFSTVLCISCIEIPSLLLTWILSFRLLCPPPRNATCIIQVSCRIFIFLFKL